MYEEHTPGCNVVSNVMFELGIDLAIIVALVRLMVRVAPVSSKLHSLWGPSAVGRWSAGSFSTSFMEVETYRIDDTVRCGE